MGTKSWKNDALGPTTSESEMARDWEGAIMEVCNVYCGDSNTTQN